MTKAQHIDTNTLSATDRDEWERQYDRVQARAAGPPDGQDLQLEYFRTALEYYIAARFAAFSFFMPMSGVLFHHAIELYLKGLLCPWLDEEQRTTLRHALPKVWNKYKSLNGNFSLSRFDDLVARIDRHWRVRYPDDIVKHGVQADVLLTRDLLDRLDEFMKVLWDKSGLNIKAFMPYSPQARDNLERENNWIFWRQASGGS
jgi:hypothetical protein